MVLRNRIWVLFVFAGILASGGVRAEAKKHSDWSFTTLGLTPIQSGGRMKPLDSFAREIVLYETGSRSYKGWNSLDLILSWVAYPEEWENEPFIRMNRDDVHRQLGVDEKRKAFSPKELIQNSNLAQYAAQVENSGQMSPQSSAPPGAPKVHPRDQELKAVLDRVGLYHGMVTGQNLRVIPQPAPAVWMSLVDQPSSEGALEGQEIKTRFMELLRAYQGGNEGEFQKASLLFRSSVEMAIPGFVEQSKGRVFAELVYSQARPFLWAWIFYLVAALSWASLSFFPSKESLPTRVFRWVSVGSTSFALLGHVVGIALRCYVAGRPPVTNMYESVIWVSFGIMGFAGILFWLHRQTLVLSVACALALLGLVAGDAAPAILDPSLNPLVPVLRSNYWLTVHVLTITLGYAAFALALGLTNITLFQFAKKALPQKISGLNQLTYRAIQFGVVFIAAGTILGGIWADYSWGRFWGWDPKEVWALITLLAYLVILHGRYANWVGPFGFAAWSAISFMTVVMAWYGVNFVLGVGLHSYGFSTGGTPWVLGFVGIQLAYVLGVSGVHFYRKGLGRVLAN